MRTLNILFSIALILFMVQCKSGGNKGSALSGKTDTSNIDTLNKIDYLLPSPDEMLSEVISHKMTPSASYTNPRENSEKYLDSRSQALNLGVYIADFAYLNMNQSKTNAPEYFKLIRDLAQKLNIYGYFDEAFFNRVQNNLMNNDSLVLISQEMYRFLGEFLENSNRKSTYALVSSGAVIESLYLSAMSIPYFKDYQLVVKKLFEQTSLFSNYYSYASQFKNDPDVNSALVQMEILNRIFATVEKKPSPRIIEKDKSNHLVIKGGDEFVANEKTFNNFKDSVQKIRQSIISF